MRSLLAASIIALGTSPGFAIEVVASIKPIHSLVAQVMGDTGTPDLLVEGSASPHTYSLKPSDASALQGADLVFWTGHGLELFLAEALETLSTGAQIVEFAETPGLTLLPLREGGAFEPHEDDHADHAEGDHADPAEDEHSDHAGENDADHAGEDHAHAEDGADMHFWLDPANAALMLDQIATALSAADPANAPAYAANAASAKAQLAGLTAELTATLAPVAETPFIVFHDAYQYFEARFGLTAIGSITVSPEVMPGAQRIADLRERVAASGALCVFAEPNFEPAIVATIIEGTSAEAATLDPEGAALTEGPGLYAELLRTLAASLSACLSR